MAISNILVPLDGSELAERALPYAERLAGKAGRKVILVRSVHVRTLPGRDPSDAQVKAIDDAERYLASIASRLGDAGVAVESAVPYGPPAAEILDETRIRQADLVLMATHGRSGVGRWVYGSVANQVMRSTQVPMLLIPASVATVWSDKVQPKVLVPLDGSALAEEALPAAREFAAALGASVVLVRIVEPPYDSAYSEVAQYVEFDPEQQARVATDYLEQTAASLRSAGLAVETRVVVGDPVIAISALAREAGAAAVAMATHGRSGLAELVLGSVATGTLQRAGLPLLLVRPTAISRPVEQPPQPTTAASSAITLTGEEITLLERGLDELGYGGNADPALADQIHQVRQRLQEAQTALEAQGR